MRGGGASRPGDAIAASDSSPIWPRSVTVECRERDLGLVLWEPFETSRLGGASEEEPDRVVLSAF